MGAVGSAAKSRGRCFTAIKRNFVGIYHDKFTDISQGAADI